MQRQLSFADRGCQVLQCCEHVGTFEVRVVIENRLAGSTGGELADNG